MSESAYKSVMIVDNPTGSAGILLNNNFRSLADGVDALTTSAANATTTLTSDASEIAALTTSCSTFASALTADAASISSLTGSCASLATSVAAKGTVNSVGLAQTGNLLSVAGSPITNSGTITLGLQNFSPHNILIGPATGTVAATPTVRALQSADVPNIFNQTLNTGSPATFYHLTLNYDSSAPAIKINQISSLPANFIECYDETPTLRFYVDSSGNVSGQDATFAGTVTAANFESVQNVDFDGSNYLTIGDCYSRGNGTTITIDDSAQTIYVGGSYGTVYFPQFTIFDSSGNLTVGNGTGSINCGAISINGTPGWNGTFATGDSRTVTVTNGIITDCS